MGVMRFQVHPHEVVQDWPEWESAYLTGLDGRVFPTRNELAGNLLRCTRHTSDSGKLHVAWPVPGFGRPVLSTASLREFDSEYLLALELARGKISELRDQTFQWEFAGMAISQEYRAQLGEAFASFSRASACRDDAVESSRLAHQAIIEACTAAQMLGRSYTEQRENSRRLSSTHPPALLGCELDPSACQGSLHTDFFDAFTAASVPASWSRIEPVEGSYAWDAIDELVECSQQSRRVVRAGPLVDFAPGGLPDWLAPWTADFDNLQSFICDFVETAVNRYAGRIRMWEVSARANTGGGLSLTEEQRLALTARTLEAAQRSDTEAQFFIRVEHPWGEYQSQGGYRISPLQFVDALIRSRIGLSGVNLEIAIGCSPRGDRHRDLLAFSRLIDQWSLLGVQLHVTLALPSSSAPDPQASTTPTPQRPLLGSDWDEATQAAWAADYVSLLLAKPHITGVFWCHFHDGAPHRNPNAGIVRADGTPKPLLKVFQSMQHIEATPPGSDSHRLDGDGTWVEG
ncbi:MAG: endo-1,4-beta-xylanase [Planctomycetaceae bacterium]